MTYKDLLEDKNLIERFNLIDNNDSIKIYHGLNHALNVIENIDKLSKIIGINDEEKKHLEISALLHDTGQLYGKDNHEKNSKNFAKEILKNKLDSQVINKILNAIEKHHEKENIDELSLFEHILLFADKMDFSRKRLNYKYKKQHKNECLLEDNIISIDFDLKEDTFIILIKTNNIDINDLKKWDYFSKIYKRCEEFASKINKNLEIKIIK